MKGGCAMGWIKTTDRLPDAFKAVLVAREGEKGGPLKVEQGCYCVNGWWKVYGTRTKSVRYWAPLPKPPKEDA